MKKVHSLMQDPVIGGVVSCLKDRGIDNSADICRMVDAPQKRITKTLTMLNRIGIVSEDGRTARHAIRWKMNRELDDHMIFSMLNRNQVVRQYVTNAHITVGVLVEVLPMAKADIQDSLDQLVKAEEIAISKGEIKDLNRYYKPCLLDEIMGCKANVEKARNMKSTVYKAKHRNVPLTKNSKGISGAHIVDGARVSASPRSFGALTAAGVV